MRWFKERTEHVAGKSVLAFTIIELVVVIAIIGVLAGIVVISYSGWRNSVLSTEVKNDLSQAAAAMKSEVTFANTYPSEIPDSYTGSEGVEVELYEHSNTTFCINGSSLQNPSIVFYIDETHTDTSGAQEGTCETRSSDTVPDAPTGLAVVSTTSTSVTISWQPVSGIINSYRLQCAVDVIYSQNLKEVTVTHPTTSATVSGYSASTSLYCRVAGVNSKGTSTWTPIQSQTVAAPAAPVITASTNNSADAIFNWPAVSGASTYTLQYNIDGGSWQTGFTNQNTRTFTVSGYNNRTVNARAISIDSVGTSSSYSSTASANPPLWGTLTYQNGWTDYGGSYATGGFTKTNTGTVVLKGLLSRTGTIVNGETIATLPLGYRPQYTLTFMTEVSGVDSAAIKIDANGNIIAGTNANETATALDRIVFRPAGSTFTPLTPILSGWANKALPDAPLSYSVDSVGRAFLQGSLDPGTITSGTTIADLPSASPDLSVSPKLIVAMRAGCNGYTGINIASYLSTRGNCLGSALYTQTMYYPDAAGNPWTTMSLKNSWVVFNASSNATPQYTKASDGIVTLKGLIKSGTTSNGVVLFTLPVGYRPSATLTFASVCDDTPCRIDIQSDGDVLGRTVSSAWTSLSGLNFVAEQ